jgi:hypothetical protein
MSGAAHIAVFGHRDEAIRLTTARQRQRRFADPVEIADVVASSSDESSSMTAAAVAIEAGHTAW